MSKQPFSNGLEYAGFQYSCCERCAKGDDYREQTVWTKDTVPKCDIEYALGVAYMTTGEITDEMYQRLYGPIVGTKYEIYGPLCAEFEPMDWETAISAGAHFKSCGVPVPKAIREFAPHMEAKE